MVNKQSSVRTTLYRLLGVKTLRAAVRDKYFDKPYEFSENSVTVQGREALLVSGAMSTQQVRWSGAIATLTGETLGLGNLTAAAVLLIRTDKDSDAAWALSYGMGFQLLDQAFFDAGFGQRIAIRSAAISELSSLTRTTLDARSRVDRLSIPSGDHLRNFGVGDFGELVTRLVAKARIPGLTDPHESLTLRGADALNLPLGRTPNQLINDLDVLDAILGKPVLAGLEMLEQLTIVKHDKGLVAALELKLDADLANPIGRRIGLAWPHEQVDETGPASAFKVSGVGRRSGPFDFLPTFEALLATLPPATSGHRVDRLRKVKFQLLSDAGEDESQAVSGAIPALKWLAYETDHDGHRYFLHNGNWYLMDQDYADKLRAQTKEVLSLDAGFTMPEWTKDLAEKEYNPLAAHALGGFVMDRKLVRTSLHRHGIELCDILLADGTLVHVKNVKASDAASHHIAQALVSSDALLYDEEARIEFGEAIGRAGGNPDWKPEYLKRVVLAMARPEKLSETNLFTFTQVTLVRNVTALRERGVDVFVVPIKRS